MSRYLHSSRWKWPRCTERGCHCVRTWDNAQEMMEAQTDPDRIVPWVEPTTGEAICACHPVAGIRARFPCDRWQDMHTPAATG